MSERRMITADVTIALEAIGDGSLDSIKREIEARTKDETCAWALPLMAGTRTAHMPTAVVITRVRVDRISEQGTGLPGEDAGSGCQGASSPARADTKDAA